MREKMSRLSKQPRFSRPWKKFKRKEKKSKCNSKRKPRFEDPLEEKEKKKRERKVIEYRSIAIPQHRLVPFKKEWEHGIFPLITRMKISACVLVDSKCAHKVELKTTRNTPLEGNHLDKCAHFLEAFGFGFDLNQARPILNVDDDDIHVDSFQIKDIMKTINGQQLSRAIGRLSGKRGNAIQNATRTTIVIADNKKIYILGASSNLKLAKDSLCTLFLEGLK